jgi:hypothetical protein
LASTLRFRPPDEFVRSHPENRMALSGKRPMTRRCFFATAGLAAAAPVAARAGEPSATADTLPKAALLSDGDAKTYLLEFRTGQ